MTRPHRHGGFAIISAIFILVVLAALGAFMLHISSNQHMGAAFDIQGVRAYQAARAGIEWGLYRRLRDGSCPGSSTPSSFTPPGTTFTGLTVTVTCVATTDASGGPTTHVLQSTACNLPAAGNCPNTAPTGNNYVERRITVTF